MNKFMKKSIALSLLLLICASPLFTEASVADASTVITDVETDDSQITNYSNSNDTVSPCAAVIGWRYKVVNGKLYRRQYNYTLGKWIGEWELCP